MNIKPIPTSVEIQLSPNEYWLRKNHDVVFGEGYKLVHRIDMSYAGKEDQEGATFMYLSEKEAEVFRKAGFDELVD